MMILIVVTLTISVTVVLIVNRLVAGKQLELLYFTMHALV